MLTTLQGGRESLVTDMGRLKAVEAREQRLGLRWWWVICVGNTVRRWLQLCPTTLYPISYTLYLPALLQRAKVPKAKGG